MKFNRKRIAAALLCLLLSAPLMAQQYDLVLAGGRVIDPESGLDAIRNIGISDGKISRISDSKLFGKRVLDARGLIVAPGFIDVHQHDQDLDSTRLKASDGVTTALEMEIGAPDVRTFLARKDGQSLINYGTSASHCAARAQVFGAPLPFGTILPRSGPATDQPATANQIEQIEDRLRTELEAGALGVGMGIQYTPGATRLEVIQMFRLAAARGVPVFTHIRSSGHRAGFQRGISQRGHRRGNDIGCLAADRSCQQQLSQGRLGMPVSDRGRPRPWYRRNCRGIPLCRRHDLH